MKATIAVQERIQVEYYPQPRPVLYGRSQEKSPPQTQTLPVRSGPPRYPPAPPLAGDAPDPFERGPVSLPEWTMDRREPGFALLGAIYVSGLLLSLLQAIFGFAQFANPLTGQIVLVGEVVVGFFVTSTLRWPGGRAYLLSLMLLLAYLPFGVVFARWQSPAFWASIMVLLYFMRPSLLHHYSRMARNEMRSAIALHGSHRPRCGANCRVKEKNYRRF